MTHYILNPNSSFASQVTSTNAIYEICHDFNLNNAQVTIGDNSILRFNGGSLSNGTINGNNIRIEGSLVKVFNGVSFKGNFLNGQVFEIEWFVGTYETSYLVNSTKDASAEFNEALNSGVKIMRFNNERYYPIQHTITVNGNLDIIGKTRYVDNSTYYLKQPCIYSKYVTTLLEYNFDSDHDATQLSKTRLDINGLHFYCAVNYDNPISDDQINTTLSNIDYTPIVRINNNGSKGLWGLHVDINISSVNNQNSKVPNWTGLEINAVSGSISYMEIHGYIAMVYQAYKVNSTTAIWATDTKIYGNTYCVIGGVFEGGQPVRNFGSHQTLSVFPSIQNGQSYFKANRFENYGYVWDLGEKHSQLNRWSCNYIAAPVNDSIGFTYDDTQNKFSFVSVECPTDVIYPNLLAETYKYRNGLEDVTVNTVISHKVNNVDVVDNIPFKRYQFPAYLMRASSLAYHASHHSDASFAYPINSTIKYKYQTTIVFSGQTKRLAYGDNPPLYIAPMYTQKSSNVVNRFEVTVNYKDENGTLLKTLSFHYDPTDPANSISSSYYFGRYVKLRNIFMDGRVSANSITEIIYTEYVENQTLFVRPVFFIPNYHADKIIRAGGDDGMVVMTEFDRGETYYHTSKGQLWWNGTKWVERDGASAGVRRSGTFAQKPSGSNIYVGFRYFCTSGVTIQGTSMTNIEIFYTGSGWVDALGRTAS